MLNRMKYLVELLNKASYHYYQLSHEIMSDYEYDKHYDELVALEKESGTVLSNSPTQKVGFEVLSGLTKVKHDKKMLSLDKTKDIEKLKDFLGDKEGILSWKLDGLTIVLTYENGTLKSAVTRGNGEIGEDITHNAKLFANIPLKINFDKRLVLRGEGIIPYSEFYRINEKLPDEEKYKNPRNLCSGTVRQLNNKVLTERKVKFYAFTLVEAEGKNFTENKTDTLDFLSSLGFEVVEGYVVTKETVEERVLWFEKRIQESDVASDGLVMTYNSISYSNSLGETAKFPKDSIAFKWKDEIVDTKLIDVLWSTSRTGLINPIAVFEPVEIEGTTVNRASVHNVSILEELKLGKGDTVSVYKANMIIPQIAENKTKSGTITIPDKCAVCGGDTEIRMLKEGKALYCTNPNCKAQIVLSLAHYCGRNAMNIEGISEETLNKFVEKGFIEYYPDIYTLYEHKDEIINMEGFGEKSYANMINAIENSKETNLFNFIYALGINNVGLSNAKLICKKYNNSIEEIISATEEDLISIEGFGEVIARSINRYFNNQKNIELLQTALKYLKFIQEETKTEDTLSGLTFVITGDLNTFTNRKELQEKIENLGGKVTGSVTKKTSYLINNDIMSSSSKNKKAKELDIPIITEEKFIEMFLK